MSISKENLRFELTLVYHGKELVIDKCMGNSLTEVLSQFLFVVRNIQEKVSGEEYAARTQNTNDTDDDIPF